MDPFTLPVSLSQQYLKELFLGTGLLTLLEDKRGGQIYTTVKPLGPGIFHVIFDHTDKMFILIRSDEMPDDAVFSFLCRVVSADFLYEVVDSWYAYAGVDKVFVPFPGAFRRRVLTMRFVEPLTKYHLGLEHQYSETMQKFGPLAVVKPELFDSDWKHAVATRSVAPPGVPSTLPTTQPSKKRTAGGSSKAKRTKQTPSTQDAPKASVPAVDTPTASAPAVTASAVTAPAVTAPAVSAPPSVQSTQSTKVDVTSGETGLTYSVSSSHVTAGVSGTFDFRILLSSSHEKTVQGILEDVRGMLSISQTFSSASDHQ